MQNLFFRYCAF